jgi:hypothetical protein
VNILVDAGLVDKNWEKQSYHGIEADTRGAKTTTRSTSRAGLTSSSPASRS